MYSPESFTGQEINKYVYTKYVDCLGFKENEIDLDCIIDNQLFQLHNMFLYIAILLIILHLIRPYIITLIKEDYAGYLIDMFTVIFLSLVLYFGGWLNKYWIITVIIIIGLLQYGIKKSTPKD